MTKPVAGIVAGAPLGFCDGLTALFTPAVRSQMAGILIGATVKGILVGVLCGLFARRFSSVPKTVAFGAGLGLFFASLVALGNHYYLQTMIPGLLAGALIGYLTQRMGQRPAPKKETANA